MTSAPSIKAILAALDESPRAPLVFATAIELARCSSAQVFLIRVLTEPTDIPPAAHTHPDHLGEDVAEIVRADFQRLTATAPDVRFGPASLVEGDPWRRILDVAKQIDVDLIVIGSHRTRGVERLLGTVAARVVNHADRSVFVVRERG